jgi:hypothetical protein
MQRHLLVAGLRNRHFDLIITCYLHHELAEVKGKRDKYLLCVVCHVRAMLYVMYDTSCSSIVGRLPSIAQ